MKENNIEFYVTSFSSLKTPEESNISFIPPILRRRLSKLDKYTLSVLNDVFSENIQNIVFSSRNGEVERLLKIINQYTEENEVSPNTFSGSVHNFSSGFFLLNNKKSIPYTAIAACENSISFGLLSSVISNYKNIAYCYGDIFNEQLNSFSINIQKETEQIFPKYRITMQRNNNKQDCFEDFIKLFNNEISYIDTSLYKIERIYDKIL